MRRLETRSAQAGPEWLERHLALVLPEKVQEALVVLWRHVEQAHETLVAALHVFEPSQHELPEVVACDVARHEWLVHHGPKSLLCANHLFVHDLRGCGPRHRGAQWCR